MSQVRFDSSKAARGVSTDSDPDPTHQTPVELSAEQPASTHDKASPSAGQEQNMDQPQGHSNAQVHQIGKALAPPDAANDQSANETSTDPDPVKALGIRVEQLENQNRWMRRITSVLSACALLGVGAWFYSDGVIVNKTIMESEELKLLDSGGNPRLFLRMYSRVPVLQLVDGDGTPRMSLGLRFDDTPFIDLSDTAGRTRATLEMTEEDAPALRLFNENGSTKFQIN